MPTVPRQTTPQVQQQAIPNARFVADSSPEQFGGGRNQAIQQQGIDAISGATERILLDEKRKADQVAVLDIDANAGKIRQNLMNEAMTKRGQDAFGLGESLEPKLQAQYDELFAKAKNDDQRAMATKIIAQQKEAFSDGINKHIAAERIRYDNELTETKLGQAQTDAMDNYNDPLKSEIALNEGRKAVIEKGRRAGSDQKAIDLDVAQFESKTHGLIINRMLSTNVPGDELRAKQYLAEWGHQIHGVDKINTDKAIEAATLRGESQRASDDIMSQGLGLSTALAEARKIEDPKLRDETTQRVKQRYADIELAKNFQERQVADAVAKTLFDSAGDVDKITPGQWAALGEKQGSYRALAKKISSGEYISTNMTTYRELERMAVERPNQFKDVDLNFYAAELDDSARTHFAKLRDGIEKKDGKEINRVKADLFVFESVLRAKGVDPRAKKGTDQAKYADRLRELGNAALELKVQELGRLPNEKERRQVYDSILMDEVEVPGALFGTNSKPLYKVNEDQEFTVRPENIKPSTRSNIIAALKARGKKTSEENILKYQQIWLRGVRGK